VDNRTTAGGFQENPSNGSGKLDLTQLSMSELHELRRTIEKDIGEANGHGSNGESFKVELHTFRAEILRELERRWEPAPSVQKIYPVDIEFPECAWTGLFRDWRDVVAPCTEAALPKLWAALLIATGLLLGRNIHIENPLKLFPNFYVLLVGQTAYARKSTVLWLIDQLVSKIDPTVEVIRGFVSAEAIFEVLAKSKGTRALGYVDEWRYLLNVAKRQGTSNILPVMNSLYECNAKDKITRKDKTTEVEEAFFSFISATPLEYAEKLLGNEEIAGGVLNRYLIIRGKEQPPKPLVKPPTEAAWQRVTIPLNSIADRWATYPKCLELDSEAMGLWCDFYRALRASAEQREAREVQLTSRIDGHVLKIALVYSAILNKREITAEPMRIAIELGKWLQASTLSVFHNVGVDPLTKVEQDILGAIEKRHWIYRRDLQRLLHANGELFGRALKSLDANGFVKCYDGKELTPFGDFSGGQARPWIEYVRL
jgi:Protein of unknown function (DUF3987)